MLGVLLSFFWYFLVFEHGYFILHWNVLNNGESVEFGLEVNATGWVALGISPNGQMPDSDIMLAWITDSGDVYLQDRYTFKRDIPILDESQDLTLISASEVNGKTYIKFSRDSFPEDTYDACLSVGSDRILYAYNPYNLDPSIEDVEGTIDWHGSGHAKGGKTLNILQGTTPQIELENDVESVELTMSNYTVWPYETVYHCKLLKLPVLNETAHIVKFDTILDTPLVHHIVVYNCPSSKVNESNLNIEIDCDTFANMPIDESSCYLGHTIFAWAVGGEAFSFPLHVGLNMSGGISDLTTQYILLEIHYDNPELLDNVIDNSGVTIYYTQTQRQYDAHLIDVGTVLGEGQIIPPQWNSVTNLAYCPAKCTQKGFSSGANIFASFLHMHTVGSSIRLRHVRNGTELAPIDENYRYDFDFQQMVSLQEEVEILPGDVLILECVYDTTNRTSTTFGGYGTRDEMCLVFFYVYGENIEIQKCLSMPIFFPPFDTWITDAVELGYMDSSFSQNYDASTQEARDFYDKLYNSIDYAQHFHYCIDANSNPLFNTIFYGALIETHPFIEEEYDYSDVCLNYVTEASNSSNNSDLSKSEVWIIVSSVIAFIILLIIVVLIIYCLNQQKRQETTKKQLSSDIIDQPNYRQSSAGLIDGDTTTKPDTGTLN